MTQNGMKKALAYLRVSTPGQGIDGFGMGAQEFDVSRFEKIFGIIIVMRVYEVESGKNNDRPKLKKAARECKKNDWILLIAKIDRLSRDALFVTDLFRKGIEIKSASKPFATRTQLIRDACDAEDEGITISERTKAGIQAKLRRGEVMGENAKVLGLRNRYMSERYARRMEWKFNKYRAEGFTTCRQLVTVLRKRGATNYRNKKRWCASMVHSILVKIAGLPNMRNQESYKILRRFIVCFTADDERAEKILDEHYFAIVGEAAKGKGGFLSDFTLMLRRAREIALKVANDNVPEKCWTEQTRFFPLSHVMSDDHKEAFCLRFYHDVSEEDIATRLRLTVKQVQTLLQQALYDISQQSIIKIPMVADL